MGIVGGGGVWDFPTTHQLHCYQWALGILDVCLALRKGASHGGRKVREYQVYNRGGGLPLDPALAVSRTGTDGTGSKAGGIVIDSLESKCTARDLQSRAVCS